MSFSTTSNEHLAARTQMMASAATQQSSSNLHKLSNAELKALLHALHSSGARNSLDGDRDRMLEELQSAIDEFLPQRVMQNCIFGSYVVVLKLLMCLAGGRKTCAASKSI